MRFTRPAVVAHPLAGISPSGDPTTQALTLQAAREDLVLGNGSTRTYVAPNGQATNRVSTIVAVGYSDVAHATGALHGHSQVYLHIHATNQTATLSLTGVIEFQDPDRPTMWIPSLEGVARNAAFAAHEFTCVGTGSWVIATREEHEYFKYFRVRFRAAAVPDANTEIWISWTPNGGVSQTLPSWLND